MCNRINQVEWLRRLWLVDLQFYDHNKQSMLHSFAFVVNGHFCLLPGSSPSPTKQLSKQHHKCIHYYTSTAHVLHLPSLQERLAREQWIENERIRVTLALDGFLTHITSAPTKELRKDHHSGKDHCQCISVLGIVDGSGQFVWCSSSFAGSIPDCVATHFVELHEFLKGLASLDCLVADAAFHRLTEYTQTVLFPDGYDEDSNSEVSAVRSTIERAWASIRSWEVFGESKFRFRWASPSDQSSLHNQHNRMLKIVMGLHNLYHEPQQTQLTILCRARGSLPTQLFLSSHESTQQPASLSTEKN